MGRHGPLTSLALGRSPYDEVIQGEGDFDPCPCQLWDDRGRPWNPASRKINKDVIRSHNEVMLVIGVAEPENGLSDSQIEASRQRHRYEEYHGRMLNIVSQHLELLAMYGVNGLRHRIMIYKRYSEIPFYQLFRYHRMNQSIHSYLLTGLPSWLVNYGLERAQVYTSRARIAKAGVLQLSLSYLRLHLIIFGSMQRAGLISPSTLFPNWHPLDPQSRRDPGFGSPDTAVPRAEENFRAAMAAAAAFSHPGGSGGGGDFGSDDEETEVVSATLISFDVEATEASDTPPGWCAELRPNVVESSGAAAPVSQEPLYRETALTMLPAALAARTLAFLPTYLVMEHFESAAWCGLVRSLLGRWGVPLDSIRQVGVFSGRGFTNLLGLNLFYFFAQAEGWAVVSMAAKGYTLEHEGDDEEPKTGSAPSPA
ncbi:hypothetical protein P8C59_004150 [Phyllachora maydis]|uniref:Uncharacterized protein n=1 Tax=Phyllachora maydis TaxID=1825666 RepID=A0AAD9MD57_9PEZI|nr:hypothetical protein P8C59_004150 [Phyllachora maydis]